MANREGILTVSEIESCGSHLNKFLGMRTSEVEADVEVEEESD